MRMTSWSYRRRFRGRETRYATSSPTSSADYFLSLTWMTQSTAEGVKRDSGRMNEGIEGDGWE